MKVIDLGFSLMKFTDNSEWDKAIPIGRGVVLLVAPSVFRSYGHTSIMPLLIPGVYLHSHHQPSEIHLFISYCKAI